MSIVDLVLPKMGESIMEATILKWHKKPGDTVNVDDVVLEVATDKVDTEVLSTSSGVIKEILFKENDVVPVGNALARIETSVSSDESTPASAITEKEIEVPFVPSIKHEPAFSTKTVSQTTSNANHFYSPLVLKIASTEGVALSELESIIGTGMEGRVTKKDLLDYIATKKNRPFNIVSEQTQKTNISQDVQKEEKISTATSPAIITQASYNNENVEIVEMDRMRKLIAKHMIASVATSPHVTSFAEADVTNMVQWRNRIKDDFEKSEKNKITFMPMFVNCIARVIKRYPMINSSVDGDKIIIKKDVNIGMATALPSGNLIVPVIKNADYLNLRGLARVVNTLADNARNNSLKPDDTQNGTFTITNIGTFNNLMGTPIINQPQVAILALGSIKKRPVVVEYPEGDKIEIRHIMYLSMSYDHRIVDGSLGATFLNEVAKEFEKWSVNKEW